MTSTPTNAVSAEELLRLAITELVKQNRLEALQKLQIKLEDAITSLSLKAVDRLKAKKISFLGLPLEIRQNIFKLLSSSEHTILVAPRILCHGPLRPLQLSGKQIHEEVKAWSAIYSHLQDTHFGLLDLDITTFKICMSYEVREKEPVKKNDLLMYTSLCNYMKIQRVFGPRCSKRNVARMAVWKRAMDLVGTSDWYKVSRVTSDISLEMTRRAEGLANTRKQRELRKDAEHLRDLGHFFPKRAYMMETGDWEKIVLREDDGLYFKAISEKDREDYVVSERFDTHEQHQRYYKKVEDLPESAFSAEPPWFGFGRCSGLHR